MSYLPVPCAIEGCDRPARKRGWCKLHYDRWLRQGRTELRDPAVEEQLRFWRKVRVGRFCWLWEGTKDRNGYGQFSDQTRKSVWAHRWAYEFLVGPIGEKMVLHHLCHVPACVNPAHLLPVTVSEHNRNGHRQQTPEEREALRLYTARVIARFPQLSAASIRVHGE